MDMKLLERIGVNRNTTIFWYNDKPTGEYLVKVMLYNREVYYKKLDKKHFNIYYNYINERVKYLFDEDILIKDYSMILIDGIMYKTIDNGFSHFKELKRALVPVGAIKDFSDGERFDLILDCTLRTGEVFDATDLVYHNGVFYNNGNIIATIRDFDAIGVEYEEYDLLNGINEEQLKCLVSNYYSVDFTRYITKDVAINIDRWY